MTRLPPLFFMSAATAAEAEGAVGTAVVIRAADRAGKVETAPHRIITVAMAAGCLGGSGASPTRCG